MRAEEVEAPQAARGAGSDNAYAHRMGFFSELRHPRVWYVRLLTALFTVLIFLALALGATAGYVLYTIVEPAQGPSAAINTETFPGHPEKITFDVPGASPRDAWFFPGFKSAPTIILCHGYASQSSDLLTLASALQNHRYNVLVFDFTGHGAVRGRTSLGYHEVRDLKAAVAAVTAREDVDASRVGLWGINMGAYVALAVAESDPRIRAVAVESAYDSPRQALDMHVDEAGVGGLPLVKGVIELTFTYLNPRFRHQPPVSAGMATLVGVPKLFLIAGDEPVLADATSRLFLAAPDPKEQAVLPRGNYVGLLDQEKRDYENRIVSFFLRALPTSD